jgi:methionine synthase II (cobalamin-independent)
VLFSGIGYGDAERLAGGAHIFSRQARAMIEGGRLRSAIIGVGSSMTMLRPVFFSSARQMKELAPRAGGFEPLRFLPKGKMIVLGLVSTKVAQLETVAELKRRIDEASKYVPLEQIAISPQCGFSSDVVGNLLSEDDQKQKLEVVVETARQVWG